MIIFMDSRSGPEEFLPQRMAIYQPLQSMTTVKWHRMSEKLLEILVGRISAYEL
jgi:hypothetical protein